MLDRRANADVLHGIDLEVGRGRLLALVGPSGAGKSTIAALVPRLYDVDRGAVELSGVDVRDLSFAALRGAVGVVTQDGHLFHDTIAANLRYAAPEASDAELVDALRRARLGDLLDALPDGLDDGGGGARVPALGRRAAAPDDRPAAAGPAAGGDPRRGHGAPRLRVRGGRAGGAGRGAGRAARRSSSRTGSRPSAPRTRSRWSRAVASWSGARTTTCSPPAGATRRCTGRSSRPGVDSGDDAAGRPGRDRRGPVPGAGLRPRAPAGPVGMRAPAAALS